MDLKERAKKIKSDIPAVFIALNRKETPIIAKIFAVITIVYALSPIDLVPDFIPVIGFLDDVILIPMLISITVRFIPEATFAKCRLEAESIWRDGKPKKWYFAMPVILVWFIIVVLIVKLVAG